MIMYGIVQLFRLQPKTTFNRTISILGVMYQNIPNKLPVRFLNQKNGQSIYSFGRKNLK